MKRVQRRTWVLLGAVALVVLAFVNLPSLVVLFDPTKHPSVPHGNQDPSLVGIWVRDGLDVNPVLSFRADGRALGGFVSPALWHLDGDRVVIDSLSICGLGNEYGSRTRTYSLFFQGADVMVLSSEGDARYKGRYRRVDALSPSFVAQVVRDLESEDHVVASRSYSIYRHLRQDGVWTDENPVLE